MLFSEIVSLVQGKLLQSKSETDIKDLAFDTRKLVSTQHILFLALKGKNQNGHQYLKKAFDKGVRNFIVSEEISLQEFPDSNIIKIEDALATLQNLAIYHRKKFDIPVIGITGSNGKTIVKEWLADLLSERFNVVKSPKSYNSQLGVPLSIWQLSSGHEIGIFEAGISLPNEMKKLEEIIQPEIGVFTNIGQAHDEGFDSLEEKMREKTNLFSNCKRIVCSRDQSLLFDFLNAEFGNKVFSWSTKDEKADLFFQKQASGFRCHFEGESLDFEIQNHQGYYLENLLHSIATSLICGLSNEEINKGIKRLRAVPMRLELKRGVNDCYVVDDSYNNDLSGLSIAFDYLKQQSQNKKKTVILSDIQQSGIEPEVLYQSVNEMLIKNEVMRFIGIGDDIVTNRKHFSLNASFYSSTEAFFSDVPVFENELILVKGARSFSLEKIVDLLEEKNHGTVLEVNFEALTHNLNTYRNELSPETKLMVMVKAFAYGGGLSEIANLLQYQNVDYLGVAYLDEGVELRRKGVTLPIMVMNPDWNHFSMTESFQLEPEIYSVLMLKRFIEVSENPSPIHLKIETGMNRLGFQARELDELIKVLSQNPQIKVAGIFTHFSSAEEEINDDFTINQAEKFNQAYDIICLALGYAPIKHALNSSGIVRWSQYQFDMVRLGIGLYGYDSSGELKNLKPISALRSRISQIREVKAGESIGYSRKGIAEQNSKVAVVSIGYADGYLRKFGGGVAHMIINGQKAPTIGNICMDMTMLDVTGIDVKEGDEVMVFGENPNIEQLAEWAETIPYEILTNVSQRVKRVFVSE